MALCCCALFAGGACYVSLVEQPTILGNRSDPVSAYFLLAQPRPGLYSTSFAALGGLAGLTAGISASSGWWLAGGILLSLAAIVQFGAVRPRTRELLDIAVRGEQGEVTEQLQSLARLHALQSILGLGALMVSILGA